MYQVTQESQINVGAPAVLHLVPRRLKFAVVEVSQLLTDFFSSFSKSQ